MTLSIGIEKLRIYPNSLTLSIRTLCEARGMDAERTATDLMVDERCMNPPWEDAVTMGVNAAQPLLTEEDRRSIGLLLVGTESSVDQEKPVSSWIHHYLGLPDDCLNLEVKHACYAATGAIDLAIGWLMSGLRPGRKALIVSTDQTTMTIGEPWEPVGGGGGAAILVSPEARMLAYELGKCGVFAHEVSDVIRPNMRVETGNSEESLFAYLTAVEGAYAQYLKVVGEPVDFDSYFKRVIYHTPFGGMTYRGHRAILRQWTDIPNKQAREHFDRKTAASLVYTRRMGATYGASTFIALIGLLDNDPEVVPGDRIGIFSYGSGSCAQFYSGLILPGAREVAAATGLPELLDGRLSLTVEQYEACERERDESIGVPEYTPTWDLLEDWYSRFYQGKGLLVLKGVKDYYREYGWS